MDNWIEAYLEYHDPASPFAADETTGGDSAASSGQGTAPGGESTPASGQTTGGATGVFRPLASRRPPPVPPESRGAWRRARAVWAGEAGNVFFHNGAYWCTRRSSSWGGAICSTYQLRRAAEFVGVAPEEFPLRAHSRLEVG